MHNFPKNILSVSRHVTQELDHVITNNTILKLRYKTISHEKDNEVEEGINAEHGLMSDYNTLARPCIFSCVSQACHLLSKRVSQVMHGHLSVHISKTNEIKRQRETTAIPNKGS